MGNVVELAQRRSAAADPGYAECACGSAWFELRTDDGPGAVVLDGQGSVTGYAGAPHCRECGRAWTPPASRMGGR